MGITNVGLSAYPSTSTDSSNSYRVYGGRADAPIYLKWRTISAAEVNKSFDIAISYRYIPRGSLGGENNGMCAWKEWTWTNIPLSECNGRQTEGQSGWQWSLDLAELLDRLGIKAAFTSGATFGFGSRKFDCVEIEVHIKSQYINGIVDGVTGGSYSPRTDVNLWIGYVPEYVIERIYCDTVNEIKVDYSAEAWERVDDRWSLEALDAGGESFLLDSKPWGTVARHSASGNGMVVIPVERLAKAAPIGENVYLKLRFNAAYRENGADFASAAAAVTCENDAECNTPTLSISTDGERVYVTVGDAGDKDKAIQSALVKLEGSEFAFDQQEVEVGGTAVFDYLPRGVPLEFSAVATAGEGTVSASATAACPALSTAGPLMLASLSDPNVRAVARYNISINDSFTQQTEVIKLAGRSRECVFYGEGGTATWSLSFDIPPSAYLKDNAESEAAWRSVSGAGDCIMTLATGDRKAVSVGNLSISKNKGGVLTSVSATLTEVDA